MGTIVIHMEGFTSLGLMQSVDVLEGHLAYAFTYRRFTTLTDCCEYYFVRF